METWQPAAASDCELGTTCDSTLPQTIQMQIEEGLEAVAENRELMQPAGPGTNLGPPPWAWNGRTPCPLLTPRTV